jgi:hypothetical protein
MIIVRSNPDTEFGLSPSQMKGVLGNEGALPLSAKDEQDLHQLD